MAIQHMENWSLYGTGSVGNANMLNGMYANVGGFGTTNVVADPDPSAPAGSQCLLTGTNVATAAIVRLILSSDQPKVGQACRVWLDRLPTVTSSQPTFAKFFDLAGSATVLDAWITPTGAISVGFSASAATVLATTAGPVVTANGWWHIETMHDRSTGEYEVRVEGVTVLTGTTVTGTNMAAVGTNNRAYFADTFAPNMYTKDWIVWDGSGTRNNDFLGSRVVYSLTPASDVALNWGLTGGAAGFSILDNRPPIDAQYIYAIDPAPDPYVGSMTNLPIDVTSVAAIMTVVRARKSDGGDGNLQVGVISGADTALGIDRPITTAFTYFKDVFEEDPATDDVWTPGAVDAANFQLDRTL